jgi:hypothetical protein
MIKNIIVLAALIVLLKNLISDPSISITDYRIIKKDADMEIRLYESGEKYRCTLTK